MKVLLDYIFPPVCPLCQTVTPEKNTVCPTCWGKISFISPPFCAQCSLPFEAGSIDTNLLQKCGSCLASPPSFSSARSSYVYDDFSKKLILSFKHGSALHAAPLLSQWMFASGREILTTCDLIVPVPLYWRRLYKRGLNQAALLVQNLGRLSKKPICLTALKRTVHTPSQGTLSLKDRSKNVASCFKVPLKKIIENKSIVLVDDVMTTGATLDACSKALLKNGAKDVKVLCVARVKTTS